MSTTADDNWETYAEGERDAAWDGPVEQAARSALPAWVLVDENDDIVASVRAETALAAREEFIREGQSGARIRRATVAPSVPSNGPSCMHCGKAINEQLDYRVVTGYERLHRAAGGTNAIRCPDRTAERYACWECVDKLANGVSPHQTALV